jgi:hypothetical protein
MEGVSILYLVTQHIDAEGASSGDRNSFIFIAETDDESATS